MNRKGFTLIELLIVVAIISILAGIVLVGLRPSLGTSRDTRRAAELRQIQTALQLYYNRFGTYPDQGTWMTDLQSVAGTIPNDPTGNSYYYKYDQTKNQYWIGAKLETGRSAALNAGHASDADANGLSNGTDQLDCNQPDNLAYCLTF